VRIFTRNQTSNETGNQVNGSSVRRGFALAARFASVAAFATLLPSAALQASAQATAPAVADQTQYGNTQTLCQPQVIGNRRIPKESVLARLFSHQGDLYDPTIVERDFNSLWNTGYFAEVRIEKVATPACLQLVVFVKENPTIRTIE
jgi:outer membrane protein insertion porin family